MPALPPTVDRLPGGDDRTGCTGVVIDGEKGYILTVDQPTQGASQRLVTFPDGQERLTSQVRRDVRSGLALLVVDPQGLNPTRVNWGIPPSSNRATGWSRWDSPASAIRRSQSASSARDGGAKARNYSRPTRPSPASGRAACW